MKRLLVIIGLFLFGIPQVQAASITGQTLLEDLNTENTYANGQYLYALGFISGVAFAEPSICAPSGSTQGQAGQIMKNYLNAHPEQWQYHAGDLVIFVLKNVWTCH